MPNTGVTITTGGRGDTIANDQGSAGQAIAITVSDPNPYDLSDISQFNASMSPNCTCVSNNPEQPPLQVCAHPYMNMAFLFRQKPLQQLSPISLSSSSCVKLPIASLQNGIRFHTFEDAIADRQLKATYDDPMADHTRYGTRDMGGGVGASSSSAGLWVNDMYARGWEFMYGDAPGYKSGRQITFEGGKIKQGLLDSSIYQNLTLTWTNQTDANGEKYIQINGMSGYYLRDITIYYNTITDKLPDRRFNLIFRFNIGSDSNTCAADAYRTASIIAQEEVIDNIGIQPSYQTPSQNNLLPTAASPATVLSGSSGSGLYTSVDTRYVTADFIELRGYQPSIKNIIATALKPSDYFDNAAVGDTFAATCDNRGRIFVFYEDEIDYTELPYISFTCIPQSSTSSAPASSTSSAPVEPPGGITTGGGGDGGGPGSGQGGAGNTGGQGIPGAPPTPINYNYSSSSAAITSSSSSSSPLPGISSSSSSSAATPPQPVTNPAVNANNDSNGDGQVIITWNLPAGSTITGQTVTESGGSSSSSALIPVTFEIDWSAGNAEGPYTEIASGLTTLQYTQSVGGSNGAVANEWNYYRIYAVGPTGVKSAYMLVSLFLVLPAPCQGRDCLGCVSQGAKSKNSFTVYFSQPSEYQLAFNCTACDGADQNSPAFIRILEEAFYQDALSTLTVGVNTSYDNAVPQMFCLPIACGDTISKSCSWTNTFYVPALTNNCAGFGCASGFAKVLVPMTITLTQTQAGWQLVAFAMGPDCKKLQLFDSGVVAGFGCTPPTRFISGLPMGEAQIVGDTTNAGTSNNICAIFPPKAFYEHTGTISVAMSPDLGDTWYQYKGIIQINNDKMAIRPVVAHDEKTDTLHLFYVERDYIDDTSQLLIQGFAVGQTGFTARVLHAPLQAAYFKETDSFKPFYPAPGITNVILPTSSSSSSSLNIGFNAISSSSAGSNNAQSSSSSANPFIIQSLEQYTREGQLLRTVNMQQIIVEIGNSTQTISLTSEFNSAYVDAQSRINYVRFRESGTLNDPPSRLTRVRRASAKCGSYSWVVSGITDTDCGCQSLMGTTRLDLNTTTANYEGSNWTLSVSSDYSSWVMTSSNGMLTFTKPRNLTQCPPTGAYKITCNRCSGYIVGTLSVQGVEIQGRDEGSIDNGNFVPQLTNLTDFGSVYVGQSLEHQFVLTNNTPNTLNLTGNPIIVIGGGNASDFKVTQNLPSSIAAYQYNIFAITFTPSTTGEEYANVLIVNSSSGDSPFVFNLQGAGVSTGGGISSSSAGSTEPDGIVYAADAVGTIYSSTDEGLTWSSNTLDIRTGQYGTCTYDRFEDALHIFYVTNSMLFARRYPSLIYDYADAVQSDLDPAFDGLNIVQPPQVVIPDETSAVDSAIGGAAGGGGLGSALGALDDLSSFFGLPNLNVPGQVLSTEEDDYTSIAIPVVNEKDYGGVPIYIVGTLNGALINGHYPYPPSYIFGDSTAVGSAKPAAYISKKGDIRFYYADINGNINAGTLSADQPIIDTKRKSK